MPKLILTSNLPSLVVVGDPGNIAINLQPKETKTVDVTADQLVLLMPSLEKLSTVKWISYSTGDVPAVEAPKVVETVVVVPKPVEPPPPPPPPAPVEPPAQIEEPPAETVAEPATETVAEAPAVEAPAETPAETPAPTSRRNRFR